MKKKWLALALSAVMAAGTLTACGSDGGNASSDNQDSSQQESSQDSRESSEESSGESDHQIPA